MKVGKFYKLTERIWSPCEALIQPGAIVIGCRQFPSNTSLRGIIIHPKNQSGMEIQIYKGVAKRIKRRKVLKRLSR